MVAAVSLTVCVGVAGGGGQAAASVTDCPWVGSSAPLGERVDAVLAQMSLDEKLSMVRGTATGTFGPVFAGRTGGIARLCIPPLGFVDGPAGVAAGLPGATQYPAPVALAATWDRDLAQLYGAAIAEEAAAKGAAVLLAPTVNIVRDPRWGRAFESFGEDPYLAGQLAAPEIRGIQSRGVVAQVKHFAVYNQEVGRNTRRDDARVDERTLQEIYLPAFEAAVRDGGAGSVMCSYNYMNGEHACSNPYLLGQVLRGQWGFDGFVTSDWFATQGAASAANAGLDLQMPDGCYFGAPLRAAVAAGQVPSSRLDDMVRNVLRPVFRAGLVDHPPVEAPEADVRTPQHSDLARRVAEAGTVLLKNSGALLPLDPASVTSIAVIGMNGSWRATTAGNGSARVRSAAVVSPLEGIARRAGAGVSVAYDTGADPARAAAVAAHADVAVVVAARSDSGEGLDQRTIEPYPWDNRLIAAVAAANPRTVVVAQTGSAFTMPWLDGVAAVLQSWYPGQEAGDALAAVLFGDVNPSAKLPVTFPAQLSQVPAATSPQWPGGWSGVNYSEGRLVGYRWYDAAGIEPLFPFGHGLSYTTFEMGGLTAERSGPASAAVEVDVANSGGRDGAEVVQVYASAPDTGSPPKKLVGFQRVPLAAGEVRRVRIELDPRAFAHWDDVTHRWVVAAGTYVVHVGDSASDMAASAEVTVDDDVALTEATAAPPVPPATPAWQQFLDALRCPLDGVMPALMGLGTFTTPF